MQFGTLTNLKSIQNYYKKCQNQSRQTLLAKLSKLSDSKGQPLQIAQEKVQKDITNTFSYLIEYNQFDPDNKIVKEICKMFNINLEYICSRPIDERAKFMNQKIQEQIQKLTKFEFPQKQALNQTNDKFSMQRKNPEDLHQFEWIGTKSKFHHLRPIFQQILLQKVKLFDNQLTQLSNFYEDSKGTTQIMTTARTAFHNNDKSSKSQQLRKTVSSADIKNRNRLKQILLNNQEGFCNIKIRDHTQFSLKKWTDKEQKEFRQKSQIFKARQNKIDNIPILFQFVKKYTKTVKARDNIFTKWENRQKTNITPDQLRYLCATSLFLNKTLAPSQKFRLKKNVQTVGKRLLSKLQFNIAQKIIQTYKIFLKKVFDLRAAYYEQLTDKRKKEYSINKKKSQVIKKKIIVSQQFEKDKKMYSTIVNSQKMKILLNPKVYRWVNLFLTNLKKKINKEKDLHKVQSLKFVKKLNDESVSPFLVSMKKKYPSTKLIVRQNHAAFRPQTKRFVQTEKFYYQKQFQHIIRKFNCVKTKNNNKSFQEQLSGGPQKQHHKIYINLSRKQVKLSSKKCLQFIILIQSKWRKHYYKKIYERTREDYREAQQKEFKQKFQRLFRIYPSNKKINFKVIVNRLKRVSMRINSLAKPYVRTVKKPINLYTSFNKFQFNLNQLKLKYSKLSYRRMMELADLAQTNQYSKIMQNGYVITAKQINNPLCSNGANILWWAVHNINFEFVKKLLQGGGDPNSKSIEDNTCLHQAMKNGSIDIIFILLDYGADLNIKNNKRVTPLYFGTKKMLKLLGLSDGTTSILNDESTIDNNSLYFRPTVDEIYPDHFY